MAGKKKTQGHYCRLCGRQRANEKFSGKGHVRHICRDCEKEQKLQARLRKKGLPMEPYVPPPPPPDDLFYHLADENEEPFDPDAFYWTDIRPFEK